MHIHPCHIPHMPPVWHVAPKPCHGISYLVVERCVPFYLNDQLTLRLSFVKGFIPYFKSEWSLIQLYVNEPHCMVAFGQERNSIVGTHGGRQRMREGRGR